MSVTIFTSSTGGNTVQKQTTSMNTIVRIALGTEPEVVFVDIDPIKRQFAEEHCDVKRQWPLLFKGNTFIGTYDDVVEMNEEGVLKSKLQ